MKRNGNYSKCLPFEEHIIHGDALFAGATELSHQSHLHCDFLLSVRISREERANLEERVLNEMSLLHLMYKLWTEVQMEGRAPCRRRSWLYRCVPRGHRAV